MPVLNELSIYYRWTQLTMLFGTHYAMVLKSKWNLQLSTQFIELVPIIKYIETNGISVDHCFMLYLYLILRAVLTKHAISEIVI